MFLAEPQTTKMDVHFRIGKIPVRVHPLFWALSIVLGMLAISSSGADFFVGVALWTAAIFISILVHELGHALVAKAYGWPPRIVLYSMGGLAIYSPTGKSRRAGIAIDFAGPGAGFVLGAAILGVVLATGHSVVLPGLGVTLGSGTPFAAGGGRLELFTMFMLYVNIFWGLLNLLPIQPLDGGHIARAILEKYRPHDGWALALKVGIATGAGIAVLGLVVWDSVFLAAMFGMLAYNNWQQHQQLRVR